ncbi:hypothetical protein V2J09_018784 [Rumex salicifolius]
MAAASQSKKPISNPIFTVVEEEEEEEAEAQRFLEPQSDGYGCFRSFPCFGSSRERASPDVSAWIAKRAKSVREFTEVVAGPRWKNLVRRVGGYFTKKKRRGFQYDSFDYALNFDDGRNDEEEEKLVHGFSARFVAPPSSSSGGVYQERTEPNTQANLVHPLPFLSTLQLPKP